MNEKIAELRKYLNLSLVAFSKPLRCSPTQVKRMEIGTIIPTEEDITKICEAFNVDEEYFKGTMTLDDSLTIIDKDKKNGEVGRRFKDARKKINMTHYDLMKFVAISEQLLSLIKN